MLEQEQFYFYILPWTNQLSVFFLSALEHQRSQQSEGLSNCTGKATGKWQSGDH